VSISKIGSPIFEARRRLVGFRRPPGEGIELSISREDNGCDRTRFITRGATAPLQSRSASLATSVG